MALLQPLLAAGTLTNLVRKAVKNKPLRHFRRTMSGFYTYFSRILGCFRKTFIFGGRNWVYNEVMKVTREQIDNLPAEIREHLHQLVQRGELKADDRDAGPAAGETGPESDEDRFERLAAAWIEKERLFSGQTAALDMEPIPAEQQIEVEDERGMLLLTNSGSLLSLWPAADGRREMEYASIPMRSDVPEILRGRSVSIDGPIRRGSPARVHDGPLKKTSPIYKIAVFPANLDKDEQAKRIREATIFLTNGFTRINKQTRATESSAVEHFNKQSIVAYIAQRSDLTQKEVRQVIDDYLSMIESGVLLGESVNLGRLGRISIKQRPPQKARVGRNPATGEEITISAKPAQGVPKISFSSHLKERAAEFDFEDEEE
jgi:nucleoid DNA-binding protein